MKAQQQVWRCPICQHEYRAALPVTEVLCPKNHTNPSGRGRSGRGLMELVEGQLPKTRKKATSGNTHH